MLTLFSFIIVFGILVFAHELGHFLAARKLGVRVEEFGFGFPPRIWSKEKRETLYSVNLIPLGGFVKLYGEQGEDEKNLESYSAKTKLQKALILVSGVTMNFLLTAFILTIIYSIGFQTFILGMENHKGVINTQEVVIEKVEEKTPAAEVLRQGDIVKKVDNEPIFLDSDIFVKINEKTKQSPEQPVTITIVRDGKEESKILKTYEIEAEVKGQKMKVRRIGVGLETRGGIRVPVYFAPFVAISETARLAGLTLLGILSFFGQIATRLTISENVVGPAKIVTMVGGAAEAGIMPLMQFMAILSISLAVINIMPIPALDGGHLLIILVEKIRRKDLSHDAKNMVQFVGFGALLLLMVLITFRDLAGVSVLEYIKRVF
ncbi:hypothetical protein COY62_02585 [bacterium (Candidatus Howlettbacteria) CG_4_10_14_0_8_um_filter_40_9]|nr:MAG: hypothetical protein COY62_02585 [bacterium (Candidatus Howlettbacteria) CG_4_10_14_0_8_um_filter_40_9]